MSQKFPSTPEYKIRFETARNGERTAVLDLDGSTFRLSSLYDPSRDAEQFAASIHPIPGDLIVLAGGGSRATRAVLASAGAFRLVYVEVLPELRDSDHPKDTRLTAVDSPAELFNWLDDAAVERLSRYRFVIYPPYDGPLGGFLRQVAAEAKKRFEKRVAVVQTFADIGDRVIENILSNLPVFARAAPVRSVFAAAPGSAVCVVASGPSLDDGAEELMRMRDRLIFVAVDSAVMPLLARGITPDIAVILDPRPDVAEHIEPISASDRSRVTWAVAASAHPSVLRLIDQSPRLVFIGDHPLEAWLADRAGDPGALTPGGSVILPAFDLARRLGAADIILAGADFSLGRGYRLHSSGAARQHKAQAGHNRFEPAESRLFMEAQARAPTRVGDSGIRSGENLLAYRDQLDRLVAQFGGRCLHLNPRLPLSQAKSSESLSKLGHLPIRGERGLQARPGDPWLSGGALFAVSGEIRRRWAAGIESDSLFRSAIEARVFRRIRQSGEAPADVWRAEAERLSAEWRRMADTIWEAR